MSIFLDNINILREKNEKLAEKLISLKDLKSKFTLEEAASGAVNLVKNDIPIHNKFDPEQEAIDLLNQIEAKHSNTINVIYGLGLGYVFKRLYKGLKGYIIVYEPDLEVLRLTFEMVDFKDELYDKRVFVVSSIDEIEEIYNKIFFFDYKISLSTMPYYLNHDLDNQQIFTKKLGYIHGLFSSNFDMFTNKYWLWINSLFDNIDYLADYDEVNSLKDYYKNKPAVIMSAGPSLNKNIDLLEKNRDKFIVFCVSTALKAAVKHNIIPDFVCFIEYLPDSARFIEDEVAKQTNIILQPVTSKSIFDKPAINKFLFYADNDEGSKWLANLYGISTENYLNRGTVSINALVSAKIMGCNPIVLVGQDLAYTNSKCYADGTVYQDLKVDEGKISVDSTEEAVKNFQLSEETVKNRCKTLSNSIYYVKGQNGQMIPSSGDYAGFIKYFEEIAKSYRNEVTLINATEGGAQIDGYKNMTLHDVIKRYCKKPVDNTLNVSDTKLEERKHILSDCIKENIELYSKNYEKLFIKANDYARKIEIDYGSEENHLKLINHLPKLLEFYKELRSFPATSFWEMLLKRTMFRIDRYIAESDDDKNQNNLITWLHILFTSEFEEHIKPIFDKLMNK